MNSGQFWSFESMKGREWSQPFLCILLMYHSVQHADINLFTVCPPQTNGGWQDAPTPSSVTSPTEGPGSVHSDTSN